MQLLAFLWTTLRRLTTRRFELSESSRNSSSAGAGGRNRVPFFVCRPGPPYAGVCLLTLAVTFAAGCKDKSVSQKPTDHTPESVLHRLIETYQDAPAYRDRGRLRLAYKRDGQAQEDLTPLTVAFSKPNQFRLNAYQVTLASDGEKLRGVVDDESSGNLDGQFATRDAPDEISLDWIYEDDVAAGLIHRGLGRQPVTLELLFAKKPLESFLKDDVARQLLSDDKLNGRECHRVKITAAEGEFVLWVDKASFLLHRMEYPTEAVKRQLQAGGAATDVTLMAEFFEADFAAPPNSQFSLKQPSEAKVVEYFVTPPQPLPSDLFGRIPESFHLLNLDTGKRLDSLELRGKLTVLLWFSDHPAGRQAAEQFERIRLANRNDNVRFILVCAEPDSVANAEIESLVESWNCLGQVARDTKAVGRDVFGIDLLPTLVVLDDAGLLHVFDEGYNAQLESDLPEVLEMLLQGENVSAAVVQQSENERLRYQLLLSKQGVDSSQAQAAAPSKRTFPAQTKPFEFEMKEVWACEKLKAPGNLLAPHVDKPILYVNEGWRSIAELDVLSGQVVAVHELELPPSASISRLSTPRGKLAGEVFVVTDILSPQAHALDANWRVLFSYPDAEQEHAGVRDVLIEDFNDDGHWQLSVGFWELLGVHGVDEKGKRIWSNRECGSVKSLSTTPTSPAGWRRLMVTGDTGRVHSFNHYGNPDPPVQVKQPIDQMFLSVFSGAESTYCGVSEDRFGRRRVRGFDQDLSEIWSYDNVPGGAFINRVQFVASGYLNVDRQPTPVWSIAGPDGSLHIISHDGRFNDFFYVGEAIHGIALVRREQQTLLVLSTATRVAAYAMEAGQQRRSEGGGK